MAFISSAVPGPDVVPGLTLLSVNKRKHNNRQNRRKNRQMNNDVHIMGRADTLARTAGFTVKRSLATGNVITLTPSSGFNLSGLTNGFTLGMSFTGNGVNFYNAAVGYPTNFAVSFADASSYNTIFDQYRIKKAKVTAWFQNDYSSTSSVTTGMPLFYVANDYDNNGIPTSANASQIMSYSNSKVYQANSAGKPAFVRVLQPRVLNTLSYGITTPGYVGIMPPNSWIDTATPTAPHFGVIIGYDPLSANQASSIGGLSLVVELEIEFRGAR